MTDLVAATFRPSLACSACGARPAVLYGHHMDHPHVNRGACPWCREDDLVPLCDAHAYLATWVTCDRCGHQRPPTSDTPAGTTCARIGCGGTMR